MAIKQIQIEGHLIGDDAPFFSIAEIGANFDGSLKRAKLLIDLAKQSGADAVKFQTFTADKLVSSEGFQKLKIGYQANWDESVVDVYKSAEFPREWHKEIAGYAREQGMIFFSAPYDKEGVDLLEEINVSLYKIGSGDLGNLQLIRYIAEKGKPVIVATGASEITEIDTALRTIRETGNEQIVLLQCVTNYPASFDNTNVKVIDLFRERYDVLTGYSDHTPGCMVALATVARGGCMIEKHFTDDKKRCGPDHPFAMDANDFSDMVKNVRLMEKILGKPVKTVYKEECDTAVIMKRSVRAKVDITSGEMITPDMITVLRPREIGSIDACELHNVIGRISCKDIKKGECLKYENLI